MNLQTGVANFKAVIDVLSRHFGRTTRVVSESKIKNQQRNYSLITESAEENGNGVGT